MTGADFISGELLDCVDTLLSIYSSSHDTRAHLAKRYPGLNHALENLATAASRMLKAEDDAPTSTAQPAPAGQPWCITQAELVAALQRTEHRVSTLHAEASDETYWGAVRLLRTLLRELTPERDGAGALPVPASEPVVATPTPAPSLLTPETADERFPSGPAPLCGKVHRRFSVSCSRDAAHTVYDPQHHDADAGVWWVDETVGGQRQDGGL